MITTSYNISEIREIIKSLGIKIISETATDFLCLCPFHSNKKTPSFALSYSKGLYICYNPKCDAKGSLKDLMIALGDIKEGEVRRLLLKLEKNKVEHFEEDLLNVIDDDFQFIEFPQSVLDELHINLMDDVNFSKGYFESRSINEESIKYFNLGYSKSQNMVTVPIHSPSGMPVGLVGRSVEGKYFKNSNNLPRSHTMFNIHRAKKEGGRIIITESTFDAIRIHQVGFPNVVSSLGGHISKENLVNLDKYSSAIIIATDNDEAGRKLGEQIARVLKHKDISWAMYDDFNVYPHEAKDIGDMTDEEIKVCIKNAKSHFEYINR
jgi:DNA primase